MGGDMAPSWGEMFYRTAVIIAVLIIVVDSMNFLYLASQGEPEIPVAPLVLAVAIWLIGYFCRFVSLERMN